jgi:hypothetical protein
VSRAESRGERKQVEMIRDFSGTSGALSVFHVDAIVTFMASHALVHVVMYEMETIKE